MAQEQGIDLGQIAGSGPGGRITADDVRRKVEVTSRPALRGIPLAGVRATIAKRMQSSLQTMAQLTLTTEADVTDLVALRATLKEQHDVTYTDLVTKAAALALQAHPRLNARLEGEEIRLLPEVHIGVAVALEDGLIVPVVRNASRKSLREISQETARLVRNAREGNLRPDEVTGSTFTITNLGMYEIDAFTPIINPPEVAILGVGRIVEKLARASEGIVWRQIMTLSLTFDHRLIDGAPAAAFLQAIKRQLESPSSLAA
ncbi:MAG TPA: dihydrolipoamide acyltransferase [Chloroflexi bacterium]|nr:dihydrolipoamide acyltransferase [Chloroflexota bacterium]